MLSALASANQIAGLASGFHRLGMPTEKGLRIRWLGGSSLTRHRFGSLSRLTIDVAGITREAATLAVRSFASARRGKPVGPHDIVLHQLGDQLLAPRTSFARQGPLSGTRSFRRDVVAGGKTVVEKGGRGQWG